MTINKDMHEINNDDSNIILGTARINLVGTSGLKLNVRVLVDNGSQVNLISQTIINHLGEIYNREPSPFIGVGGNHLGTASGEVWLNNYDSFSWYINFQVLIEITVKIIIVVVDIFRTTILTDIKIKTIIEIDIAETTEITIIKLKEVLATTIHEAATIIGITAIAMAKITIDKRIKQKAPQKVRKSPRQKCKYSE